MIALSAGLLFSDRVEALLDGRVAIDGAELSIRFGEAQALFRAVLREGAYDLAELSMASHIAALGAGRRDYRALPVFPSRSFRHGNLYVRTDRGIAAPGDLAGRRIGLIDWQQTAALWVRGILAEDHGVARSSVEWIAGGLHASVPEDRVAMAPPAGIRLSRTSATLDDLLRRGEIDAIVSPSAPRCFGDPAVPVARMWPDTVAAERDWWHRTGIFPIMHVLVLRRSIADTHPGLAEAVATAFDRALALALGDVATRDFPKVALPWLNAHAAHVADALGEQPWRAGFEANRPVLDRMIRHAVDDGLLPGAIPAEALFA